MSVRTLNSRRTPDLTPEPGEPAFMVETRSPAAYFLGDLGLRRKMRRHQGRGFAVTTWAVTRLLPHRRQNLRFGSLGSPQLEQIRSPGCATRRSTVAAGLGRAATWEVGSRAAG